MKKFKAHILIVDDDDRIRELVKQYLEDNGYLVTTANSAEDAKKKVDIIKFDLIVLDIMMPGQSGLEFTIEYKKKIKTPIVLLTAKGETNERVKGLEVGADDYLGKPFEPKELLLRIEAILKRLNSEKMNKKSNKLIRMGNISFDINLNIIWKNNKKIFLTYKEGLLLKELINSKGVSIDRYSLNKKLQIGDRGIDITISRLRKKIEDNPKTPEYILTERGRGYIINNEIRVN